MHPKNHFDMKRYWGILCGILFASLMMISCSDYNSPDNYYVKYSLSAYPSIVTQVTYADVNDTKSVTLSTAQYNWTITVGPVKKGFNAYVKTEKYSANAEIEISRNGEPFVQKATGQNSATYIIDF